jgi:hypothetical protein
MDAENRRHDVRHLEIKMDVSNPERWSPSFALVDDEQRVVVRFDRAKVVLMNDDGSETSMPVHSGRHRRTIVDGSDRERAAAVKTSGAPWSDLRCYEITWTGAAPARFELVAEQNRRHVKRLGKLLWGGDEVVLTTIEYADLVGDWKRSHPLAVSTRAHSGIFRGAIDASLHLPTEVVALCVLLTLRRWARRAPRQGPSSELPSFFRYGPTSEPSA